MKQVLTVILVSVLVSYTTVGQLKSKAAPAPSISESLVKPTDAWLDLFDVNKLSMRHSYSLMYTSVAGKGLSVGMYTNSLMYKFSDMLDLQADVSVMHSPYSSFGNQSDLSGIFLNRAELNYRPTENMWLQLQFRQVPPMYWLSGYRNQNFFYGIDRYEDNR